MFFVLSKTLNYLVMPLTVIVILFIVALFLKKERWKRRLVATALGLLLFFTNPFLANEAMRAWEIPATPFASMTSHEVGVVLTGSMHGDREPNDRVYFIRGADRVTHTVQLYKLGLIRKILVSGGSGRLLKDQEPEADKFQRVMVMMGVPESDIILENKTRNTAESAIAVKEILRTMNVSEKDCLLITSAFHMRRSLAVYKKNGLHLQSFTTDFYSEERSFSFDTLVIPRVDALVIWTKLIKEWVGITAYSLVGYA